MGVTIHFEGGLRDEEAYASLVNRVTAFAGARDWPSKPIAEPTARLTRVFEDVDREYVGATRGVEVLPHPGSEPLRFEFDDNLFVQEFCKTQFAGAEAHVEVVMLLQEVAPLFETFEVIDEGEYWETNNQDVLQSHLDQTAGMLAVMLRDDPTAEGPVRLESGRIADLVQGETPPEPRGLAKLFRFLRR